MTTTAPSYDTIQRALLGAAPDLAPAGQRVAVSIYRLLSLGDPVRSVRIAEATGASIEETESQLAEWSGVLRDEDDDVIGFWGLALPEMPHQMIVDGNRLHTWCAWDPLFLARVVGDADVVTVDPVTSHKIRYRIVDGAIADLSHPEAVLSFISPDVPWDDDIIGSFCQYVNHFTSAETADQWTTEHPGTFTLTLDDAVALAEDHITHAFGDAL